MLTIRNEQLAALQSQARTDFRERLTAHLTASVPHSARVVSNEWIDAVLESAASLGVTSERDAARYAELRLQHWPSIAEPLPEAAVDVIREHGRSMADRLIGLARSLEGVGPRSAVSARQFGDRRVISPVVPCVTPAVHWVEIRLVDDDGMPVKGERYRVELPNGEIASGTLDDNGAARIEQIPNAGNCVVMFPNLDKEAWTGTVT